MKPAVFNSRFVVCSAVVLALALFTGCADKNKNPGVEHKPAPEKMQVQPIAVPDRVAGLKLDTGHGPQYFTESNLWEHMNGAAHEIIRLGFEQLAVAYYRDENQRREVRAQVFVMASPQAAEELFNAWSGGGAVRGDICGRSAAGDGVLTWQNGAHYVQLMITTVSPDTDSLLLETMGRELCGELAGNQPGELNAQ